MIIIKVGELSVSNSSYMGRVTIFSRTLHVFANVYTLFVGHSNFVESSASLLTHPNVDDRALPFVYTNRLFEWDGSS